ncbi:MAG: HmuY family protein [Sphingobacteriales bacterium]|nr:HmuY family protein [Sphingobacteriales bacterium]
MRYRIIDMRKIGLASLLLLVLSACEKPEKPYGLPPKPINAPRMMQVDLGDNYEQQTFINFTDSQFVKNTININSWDIAFDCNLDVHKVLMNGGKGILIGKIESSDFVKDLKPRDVKFRWDAASGGDSIVINNWHQAINTIYVVDRGIAAAGAGQRYFQFKLVLGQVPDFWIEVADMAGKVLKTVPINRVPNKNYVYYNFEDNEPLNFEPNNDTWHFCFLPTRWIYYEYNPPLLYIVTGIHINPKMLSVATDSSLVYENITAKDVLNLTFENRRDAMGFEWKIYDFGQGRYLTRKYVNYIFKTNETLPKYYKLRFIDFYSKQGIKGSPRFEVLEIK